MHTRVAAAERAPTFIRVAFAAATTERAEIRPDRCITAPTFAALINP